MDIDVKNLAIYAAVGMLGFGFANAVHASTEFPPEVLGSYSIARTCDPDTVMVVNPSSVTIEAAGALAVQDNWDICLSCAGGASGQSSEVMAFPIGDGLAPVFTFSAGPEGKVTVEYYGDTPLQAPMLQMHEAETLLRCQ